ncbi:MFS transporter [Streptomyces profundus]|uniref:MFS transporter n=1 Tax=Streptomyces profundus TaxID=2867410 RepID=UPI001D166340|nr:MFS transporter [Streptomyces sp. MA3_2.13]UED87482.1 MFS transporter [Streptomyces sp. MA3_2.13]
MNPTPARQGSGRALGLLAFAQFIVAIDYNIVYVALPDIGRELNFSAQSLQWVVTAYAVAFGGLLLLGGRAADRLGPRRMFLSALLVYGVASLVGGLTTSGEVLVAARAVQGLGGAFLFPATLKLINTTFDEGPARNRALATWGAAGSAGLAFGALLGGVLTEYLGWAWVFFVNVPLALAAAFAAPRWLRPDSPAERGSGFDVPGALIATAGVTLLVLGLVSGPEAGWLSVRGAGSLVAGLALLGVFLLVERRTRDPLVPLRMFGNRSLVAAMLVIFLYLGVTSGQYYLFTTYLQNVLDYEALAAGLAFLPPGLLSALGGGPVAAWLVNRLGTRTTLTIGMLITGVGLAMVALAFSADGSFLALLPGIVVWGLGGGVALTTLFVSAASGVAPQEQGIASAMASTAQQIGAAVGLAVIVAVANAGLDTGASDLPTGEVVDGLRTAGLVGAGIAVAGALIALAIRPPAAPAPAPVPDAPAAVPDEPGAGEVTGSGRRVS